MSKPDYETLARMQRDFGGHPWGAAELEELVEPRRGIITGFEALLRDLEAIRQRPLPPLPATAILAKGQDDGSE